MNSPSKTVDAPLNVVIFVLKRPLMIFRTIPTGFHHRRWGVQRGNDGWLISMFCPATSCNAATL